MRNTVSIVVSSFYVLLLLGDCAVSTDAIKTQPTVAKGIYKFLVQLFFLIFTVYLDEYFNGTLSRTSPCLKFIFQFLLLLLLLNGLNAYFY